MTVRAKSAYEGNYIVNISILKSVLILIKTYFCTRIYRRLPFKKFSHKKKKAYGSNILADQRLAFV